MPDQELSIFQCCILLFPLIAESILLKSRFTTILTTLNNLLKMTSIVMCKWDKDSDKDAAGGDTTNQSLTVTVTIYFFFFFFLKKLKIVVF